jgi:hypothetical protein
MTDHVTEEVLGRARGGGSTTVLFPAWIRFSILDMATRIAETAEAWAGAS